MEGDKIEKKQVFSLKLHEISLKIENQNPLRLPG